MNAEAMTTLDAGVEYLDRWPAARELRGPEDGARLYRRLARMRYQFMGGMLFSTLPPAALSYVGGGAPGEVAKSFLASFLAFSVGFIFFRKLTAHPGVRAIGFIMPSFAAAYGLLFGLFVLVGLEFSQVYMIMSLVLAVAWFLCVFILARRGRQPSLAIVPGGAAERMRQIPGVNWGGLPSAAALGGAAGPVVADLRADLSPEWERAIADAALQGRPVYHFKQLEESLTGRVNVEHLSENPCGSLTPSLIYMSAKRYVDFALGAGAIVILAPFMALIALAIRLETPGPAIFRQTRIGLGGQPFTMLKFRSMREATAAERADPDLALRHDETRVTRLGGFLRGARLDELPQIINILRGEMSWIGPRPEAIALSRLYEAKVPFYRYRHIVRPGVTGWAQVNQGHVVGVESAEQKLQFDFFYVKHFSLWLDMLVFMRTARVILTGNGAR